MKNTGSQSVVLGWGSLQSDCKVSEVSLAYSRLLPCSQERLQLPFQELLWRGQLCLEQFFDATALCSVSDASLAPPSDRPNETVDYAGVYEMGLRPEGCLADQRGNVATSARGDPVLLCAYPEHAETLPPGPGSRGLEHPRSRSSVIFSSRWIAWCGRIGAVVTLRPGARLSSFSSSRLRQSPPKSSPCPSSLPSLPAHPSQPPAGLGSVVSSTSSPVWKTPKSFLSTVKEKETRSEVFLGKTVEEEEEDDWILSPGLGPETYAAMPALDSFPFVSAASAQTAKACRAVLRFTTPVAAHTPQPHLRISLEANPFLLYLLSPPSILIARTLQLNDFASCA